MRKASSTKERKGYRSSPSSSASLPTMPAEAAGRLLLVAPCTQERDRGDLLTVCRVTAEAGATARASAGPRCLWRCPRWDVLRPVTSLLTFPTRERKTAAFQDGRGAMPSWQFIASAWSPSRADACSGRCRNSIRASSRFPSLRRQPSARLRRVQRQSEVRHCKGRLPCRS